MFARVSLVVLAAIPLTAATAFADPPVAERVVMDYVAAWNMHDPARASAQLAYDVTYTGAGTTVTGREATRLGVQANELGAVPDGIWALSSTRLTDDNKVDIDWEISGINTGMWPDGALPTGKHVVVRGKSTFEVENGKIVRQTDVLEPQGS